MSRAFNIAKLKKRARYAGFLYTAKGEAVEKTGAEWREWLAPFRIEHNGDCIAAYEGVQLRAEVMYP